jgi:hypothetical protein
MTTTCQECGSETRPTAKFCGSCGAPVAEPTEAMARPQANVSATPAHVVADPGLQSYVLPDPSSAFGPVLPGGTCVDVIEVRAAWANVRDESGRTAWVDGRRLVPPTVVQAPTIEAQPTRTTGTTVGPGAIIGVLGAIGVVVGSLLNWVGSSEIDFSSFKVPVSFLFDYSSTAEDPKTGYFLLAAAIVGLICCFVRNIGWLRVLCGLVAVAAPVLYGVQINDALNGFGSVTDALGPGVWVTGIAGIVLAISPAFPSSK